MTSLKNRLSEAIKTDESTITQEAEENATQAKIEALQERLKKFKSVESEANMVAVYKIKQQLKELVKKKILLQNNSLTSITPEDRINHVLKALKGHSKIDSIDDINFKEVFSKIIVYKRDQLVFVIGSPDCSKIKKKPKTIFNGTIEYKQRSTIFKAEFGICINF